MQLMVVHCLYVHHDNGEVAACSARVSKSCANSKVVVGQGNTESKRAYVVSLNVSGCVAFGDSARLSGNLRLQMKWRMISSRNEEIIAIRICRGAERTQQLWSDRMTIYDDAASCQTRAPRPREKRNRGCQTCAGSTPKSREVTG